MKKTFLLLMIIGFAFESFGQAKVEFGLKAGANFANPTIETVNSESVTSFHGGAFFLVKLANIGIQPEILYSSQIR